MERRCRPPILVHPRGTRKRDPAVKKYNRQSVGVHSGQDCAASPIDRSPIATTDAPVSESHMLLPSSCPVPSPRLLLTGQRSLAADCALPTNCRHFSTNCLTRCASLEAYRRQTHRIEVEVSGLHVHRADGLDAAFTAVGGLCGGRLCRAAVGSGMLQSHPSTQHRTHIPPSGTRGRQVNHFACT